MRIARALAAAAFALWLAHATAAAPEVPVDPAQRAAQEKEARRKLDAVRAELAAMAAQRKATGGELGEAERLLRGQELALATVARDVHQLDERLAAQQERLDELGQQRERLEAALATQREGLAALLRSAYTLGHDAELKLLLQQDDVAAVARVLAYHRYFQRARVDRIDRLREDLARLEELRVAIDEATAGLAATRAERTAEAERLEHERAERQRLVAELGKRLAGQGSRIAALERDAAALDQLLQQLRDVFVDIPRQLSGAQPFASRRGQLPWPLKGKVLVAFGADEGGRRSSGMWLSAPAGTTVAAVAHGRVAFADWLRGYGLMVIVDHGDGYLSLYGGNESLLKDVGDWVDGGDALATSGASVGQSRPALYFELRARGKPIDPRRWLRPR